MNLLAAWVGVERSGAESAPVSVDRALVSSFRGSASLSAVRSSDVASALPERRSLIATAAPALTDEVTRAEAD